MTDLIPLIIFERGACAGTMSNLWISDRPTEQSVALHICQQHCPIVDTCRNAGQHMPDTARKGAIYGGITYDSVTGHANKYPAPADRCDQCTHLRMVVSSDTCCNGHTRTAGNTSKRGGRVICLTCERAAGARRRAEVAA